MMRIDLLLGLMAAEEVGLEGSVLVGHLRDILVGREWELERQQVRLLGGDLEVLEEIGIGIEGGWAVDQGVWDHLL
jgi:hypothetical protein